MNKCQFKNECIKRYFPDRFGLQLVNSLGGQFSQSDFVSDIHFLDCCYQNESKSLKSTTYTSVSHIPDHFLKQYLKK